MSQTANEPKVQAKFWLGQLFLTKAATTELVRDDVLRSIASHSVGDWGNLCADDKEMNENALRNGGRIFSAYRDSKGVKF